MKKTLFLLSLVATFVFAACDPKGSKEYISAMQEVDSLRTLVDERDAEVKAMFETMNEIEDNLAAVNSKFHGVDEMKRGNTEVNQDVRARITAQISAMNDLMTENKKKVDDLNRKLSNSNARTGELKKYVEKLEVRIAEQDAQIQALLADLEKKEAIILDLNKNISTLTKDNQDKETLIVEKTTQANTAYYVIGTRKQLRDANLIDKKGGFIGIGRQTVMNKDADSDRFTKIDITQTTSISIPNAKKITVITTHPDNTYDIPKNAEKKYDVLRINNPAEFWRVSKYLVLLVD